MVILGNSGISTHFCDIFSISLKNETTTNMVEKDLI